MKRKEIAHEYFSNELLCLYKKGTKELIVSLWHFAMKPSPLPSFPPLPPSLSMFRWRSIFLCVPACVKEAAAAVVVQGRGDEEEEEEEEIEISWGSEEGDLIPRQN